MLGLLWLEPLGRRGLRKNIYWNLLFPSSCRCHKESKRAKCGMRSWLLPETGNLCAIAVSRPANRKSPLNTFTFVIRQFLRHWAAFRFDSAKAERWPAWKAQRHSLGLMIVYSASPAFSIQLNRRNLINVTHLGSDHSPFNWHVYGTSFVSDNNVAQLINISPAPKGAQDISSLAQKKKRQ